MDIKDLAGKLVAVLGFGAKEGRATTEYLLKQGITPVLFDQKPWDEWAEADKTYIRGLGVNFIFGPGYWEELRGFNIAFRTPGISRLHPKLLALEKKGLVISSQTKWFFEHCPAKIIGVTGTKGKGTTCSLIFEILNQQLPGTIFLTGNIGGQQPLEFLDTLSAKDIIVYELSSFQLQDLTQSPQVGVVLMVTQDHLDYHASAAEYREAKSAIDKFQTPEDFVIYNTDYPATAIIGQMGNGKKIPYSTHKDLEVGYFVRGSQVASETQNFDPYDLSQTQLRGKHNWENILPAIAVGELLGINHEHIQQSVNSFKGLEHRLEYVAEKNGVKYYNDSISTTPETAVAALLAFTEPEIIILGGASKQSDFSELGKTVSRRPGLKAVVLIGPEAPRIKQAITQAGPYSGIFLEGATQLTEAFQQIQTIAQPGDVVLLSPACTSFNEFSNYRERGNEFKRLVNLL